MPSATLVLQRVEKVWDIDYLVVTAGFSSSSHSLSLRTLWLAFVLLLVGLGSFF